MDIICNIKKCRKPITSLPWVTSCGHTFCPEHGQIEFEYKYKNQDALVCPVCDTALNERFDVVQSNLNPHESYKSVILSGMEPNIIIDIAMRAINFWISQMEVETKYQRDIGRITVERIHNMQRYSKIHQYIANAELQNKNKKIKDVEVKYKNLKKTQTYDDLPEDFENARQKKFEMESLKRNTEKLNVIEDILNNGLQTPKGFNCMTPELNLNTSTGNESVSNFRYKMRTIIKKHTMQMANKNEDEFIFNPVYVTDE